MANTGTVQALVGKGDTVFADKLNHASLNDAMLLSRAAVKRYRHGDLAQLEQLLAQARGGRKLVITDAVFSMDGDLAPLPQLLALCERFDAWLLVDDAHGFGVLGEHGRGSLAHCGIASPRIVYMATLGKAAGVFGAFVAAEQAVIDTLLNHARSYVYTTAMPPALASALLQSLRIIEQCLNNVPAGSYKSDHPLTTPPLKEHTMHDIETLITHFLGVSWGPVIPPGEASVGIEATKGNNSYYLTSDGNTTAYRVRIRTPSFPHMQMLPLISKGYTIPDLLSIIGAMDFVLADLDR